MEYLGNSNKNKYLVQNNYTLASFNKVDSYYGFYSWLSSKLYDDISYSVKSRLLKRLGLNLKANYTSSVKDPLGSRYYDEFSRMFKYCLENRISVGAYIDNTFRQQQMIFKGLDKASYEPVYRRYISLFPAVLFKKENYEKYAKTHFYYNSYMTNTNQAVSSQNHILNMSNSLKTTPGVYLADYILSKATSGDVSFKDDCEGLTSVLTDKYNDLVYGKGDYVKLANSRLDANIDSLMTSLESAGITSLGLSETLAMRLYGCNFRLFNYYPVYAMNDYLEETFSNLYNEVKNKSWSSMTVNQLDSCYWFSFGWDSHASNKYKLERLKGLYGSIYHLKCNLLVFSSIVKSFTVIKINFKDRVDMNSIR